MNPFSMKSLAHHPSFQRKRKEPPDRPVANLPLKRPIKKSHTRSPPDEDPFYFDSLCKELHVEPKAEPQAEPQAQPQAQPKTVQPQHKDEGSTLIQKPLQQPFVPIPQPLQQLPSQPPSNLRPQPQPKTEAALAAPQSRFFGQDHNVAKLRAWYASHNNRPAVLWGAPGTGKSSVVRTLAPNVVEYTPSSHDILDDLKRSLQACALFGDALILLDDVDGMSPQLLENIIKAFKAVGKRTTCPLAITCSSLHTLPKILTEDSLILHFARLQTTAMFALLRSVAPAAQNLDRIVHTANGDARQALLTLQFETQGLGCKDDSGSPFQMVFAAMHRLSKQFTFDDFHATIFAHYIVCQTDPRHPQQPLSVPKIQASKKPKDLDADNRRLQSLRNPASMGYNPQSCEIGVLEQRTASLPTPSAGAGFIWAHEEVFVVAAPMLSDWRMMLDGAGLQQDMHTLEMRGVQSFLLEGAMRSMTRKPPEIKTFSKAHAAVFHPRQWSPTDDLLKRLKNLRI